MFANKAKKFKVLILISVLLSIIFASLPQSVLAFSQNQETQNEISAGEESRRLTIGLNVTGITHYGYGDLLPYAPGWHVDKNLKEAQRMGVKIVRIFVANNRIGDGEAARRLNAFLTKANAYDISVIVSFIDFYYSGFNPRGTNRFYETDENGWRVLNHDFFHGGYRDRYKKFVKTVVNKNKHHPNIYAWEPGNELKDNEHPRVFLNFMKKMTAFISNLDPDHPVASGMLNAGHTNLSPSELYGSLPNLDIITIHPYNGTLDGTSDVEWTVSHGKQAIVEEIGFSGTSNRAPNMRRALNYWKNKGVSTVLQYGFIAKGLDDNGDGDRDVGMDDIWHTDYDKLFRLFKSFAKNPVKHALKP